jgi:hypothetical protein
VSAAEEIARARGLEPWVAEAIAAAGLPPRLGLGRGGGLSADEVAAVEAEKGRRARAAALMEIGVEPGTEPAAAPRAPRPNYPPDVRAAARRARELLDGKGAPGPKQAQAVADALAFAAVAPLEAAGAGRESALAYAAGRGAEPEGFAAHFAPLVAADPFTRGRRLAALLVSWHDVGEEER